MINLSAYCQTSCREKSRLCLHLYRNFDLYFMYLKGSYFNLEGVQRISMLQIESYEKCYDREVLRTTWSEDEKNIDKNPNSNSKGSVRLCKKMALLV